MPSDDHPELLTKVFHTKSFDWNEDERARQVMRVTKNPAMENTTAES